MRVAIDAAARAEDRFVKVEQSSAGALWRRMGPGSVAPDPNPA
jgi:hypothetical protein